MERKMGSDVIQITVRFLAIIFGPAFAILLLAEALNYFTEPYWAPFK